MTTNEPYAADNELLESNEELCNEATVFSEMLNARPLDWPNIIAWLTSRGETFHLLKGNHFKRALHLASAVDDANTRINNFFELVQLLSMVQDPKMLSEAILDQDDPEGDGVSPLHRSCIKLNNNLYTLSNHSMCSVLLRYVEDDDKRILNQDSSGRTLLHYLVKWRPQLDNPTWCAENATSKFLIFEVIQRFAKFDGVCIPDLIGNNALHCAVLQRLDSYDHCIEKMLFDACPKALINENDQGLTPLQIILNHLSNLSVEDESNILKRRSLYDLIRHMIHGRANLELMKERFTKRNPLHTACLNNVCSDLVSLVLEHRSYFKTGVSLASDLDYQNCTPLHLACRARARSEVLRQLLLAYPSAASSIDSEGRTPLYVLWHSHSTDINALLTELDTSRNHVAILLGPRGDLFCKLSMLVQAQCFGMIHPANSTKILHGASGLDLPTSIFHIFLKVHAGQALEFSDGLLPLHRWCTRLSHSDVTFEDCATEVYVSRTTKPDSPGNSSKILALLIDAAPKAVEICDANGQTPLLLSIRNHKQWKGEIEAIMTSYPSALATFEKNTMLLPFMVAATLSNNAGEISQELEIVEDRYKKLKSQARQLKIMLEYYEDSVSGSSCDGLAAGPENAEDMHHKSSLEYAKVKTDLKEARIMFEKSRKQYSSGMRSLNTIYSLLRADPSLICD